MKEKLNLALSALFMSLILISCSSNDDRDDINDINPLVGKWYQSEVVGERVPLNECEKNGYYAFTKDDLTVELFEENKNSDCLQRVKFSIPYNIINDRIVTSEGEIIYKIENNTLSLFHLQSNNTFVEIRYSKR